MVCFCFCLCFCQGRSIIKRNECVYYLHTAENCGINHLKDTRVSHVICLLSIFKITGSDIGSFQ